MAYDGSLRFNTDIDETGFNRGTRNLERSSKKLGIVSKLSLGALAVGLLKLANQGKELASDLQEVQNVVDTVFGDMADDINNFAKTSIDAFGLSELSAKQYASTFGAMLKPTGLLTTQILEMSKVLTGASGGMASFFNKSAEIVSQDLQSYFAGSTETMYKYGLIATVTNLENFALAEGIKKTWQEMSQAEQQMLRYNYLVKNLGYTFDDFRKTQDSYANQQRILTERWKEFLGLLGNNFIRVLTPVIQGLNKLLETAINLVNYFQQLNGVLADTTNEQMSNSIKDSTKNQEGLNNAIKKGNKEAKGMLASFDEVNIITDKQKDKSDEPSFGLTPFEFGTQEEAEIGGNIKLSPNLQLVVDSVAGLLETLKDWQTFLKEEILNPLMELAGTEIKVKFFEVVALTIDWLNEVFEDFTEIGKDVLQYVLLPLAKYTAWGFVNLLKLIAIGLKTIIFLFNEFPTATKIAIGFALALLTPFGFVIGILTLLSKTIQFVIDKLFALNDKTKEIFTKIIEVLRPIANFFYTNLIQPIANLFIDMWEFIKGLFFSFLDNFLFPFFIDPLVNFFGQLFELLKEASQQGWEIIKAVWKTIVAFVDIFIVKPIKESFSTFWENTKTGFGTMVEGIKTFLKPIVTWITENVINPISNGFATLWGGIKDIFVNTFDDIKEIFKGIINSLATEFEGLLNILIAGINFAIDEVNSLSYTVPAWVPSIGGQTFGFDLDKLDNIKVPRLAEGGVIPPNSEFLAVLGDQKEGMNIETPLDTMIEAFETALESKGLGNINIIVKEKKGFAKMLKFELDKESARQGRSKAILGGV